MASKENTKDPLVRNDYQITLKWGAPKNASGSDEGGMDYKFYGWGTLLIVLYNRMASEKSHQ